ncbi:MAG: U32 family peptidase [Bacilli bacterium]|nr:U32 family peptidase [Bacilli bacterium]
MKLLIEPKNKKELYIDDVDGIILPLKDYAVESIVSFSLTEIKEITKACHNEIFIKINKNILNEDIEELTSILQELDKLNITGIFFYDLALLELKKELNLKTDLVWNQTHMVNNYRTCDYYYNHGVKYALLGKEITLDEIIEIIKKSKITSMVEVVSKPSVAFSKRKLVTNYYKDLGKDISNEITVKEKITDSNYEFIEDSNGTSIFLDKITNGTVIIKDLYDNNCQYIIFREYGIDNFKELIIDTMNYIKSKCEDERYVSKYSKLGDSTNFFFKKTIYKVKK